MPHQFTGDLVHPQFPPSPPSTAKPSRSGSVDAVEERLSQPLELLFTSDVAQAYPLPPKSVQKRVLTEDLKTPDSHVERDPRLIRLTGVHPFNVEPPLTDLYNEGFLTSQDLHYVRNHGPVPKCGDEDILDWEFTVEGLVERPVTMTVRDLLTDYNQVTYPITLVCAGNRRKEQNMVRKSKGFSWGAAGLSTALWTGVPIAELLLRAQPRRGARYICFEGADKLPNGYYGTSLKLNWCMDPNKGIMVAHKMNGEQLHPDHGKPVRIVVPGQIGGRSVKWLKRILVTAEPSDNWYHIYDNRVLPTMVTPEAGAEMREVWKDERYAIYDLNANSAICYPAHDETVSLATGQSYKVRGYAYGGGGKRITRMEVTLDKGKTWSLASLKYPEDDYRLAPDEHILYGGRVDMWWREASFCWCFWELDISLKKLREADDIIVRAMDEGMMVQPRDMYWSVLGMMNNPWFRVVIHKDDTPTLRFEHPTQPALIPGGWMDRVKKAGGDLKNGFWGERIAGDESVRVEPEPEKEICMTNPKVDRKIAPEELRQHDGEDEPWFVINGEVYDGTAFLEGHPGGAASIIGAAGQDPTVEFVAIHSENAKAMMPDYHVGTLDEASQVALPRGGPGEDEIDPSRAVFLQSKTWAEATLEKKERVSPDSFIFIFKLDHENQNVGLPTGQHLMMRLRDPVTREAIIRAYTPLSEAKEKGKLRILIKVYYDTPEQKGGKMTQALDAIPLGRFVDFKGPLGKFEYLGRGQCSLTGSIRHVCRFIMVCGGSGITPIFQVLRTVMQDPEDHTECLVLDGNRVEQDILCRAELDTMAAANKHKYRLVHTLSRPGATWRGRRGRMDKPFFTSEVGPPRNKEDRGEMVLICGPEPMERTIKEIFLGMGWDEDSLLFF